MNTSDLCIAQIMANLATLQNRFTVERCRQAKIAMARAGLVPFRLQVAWDRGPGGVVVKSFDPTIRHLRTCGCGLSKEDAACLNPHQPMPVFLNYFDGFADLATMPVNPKWATIPRHSPTNRQ